VAIPTPIGQYVAIESPVHDLDARVKLVIAAGYTLALFAVTAWSGLAACGAMAVGAIALSRVPVGRPLRALAPVAWLLGFTLIANALRWQPAEAIVRLGPFGIDGAGLRSGLFFSARIVLLVVGTSLVTLTTSPVALTDAFASLMRPLRLVRVPVDDAAMMFSIALRFMPVTAEEAERVVVAQTARGARFAEGGPIRRARAWVPVLVPLFVRLFRRADALATAMEARCYRGSGRTRLRELCLRPVDWISLATGITLLTAIAVLL